MGVRCPDGEPPLSQSAEPPPDKKAECCDARAKNRTPSDIDNDQPQGPAHEGREIGEVLRGVCERTEQASHYHSPT